MITLEAASRAVAGKRPYRVGSTCWQQERSLEHYLGCQPISRFEIAAGEPFAVSRIKREMLKQEDSPMQVAADKACRT